MYLIKQKNKLMPYFISFLPILLFVILFVGSGVYFTATGVENAFYQFSPLVAIMPAIALGWMQHKGKKEQRMHAFLDGVRHRDIITMCIIFLLAGAFSEVTKSIGSVEATVNLSLSFIPTEFLLIGLFFISAFISTAIGTSMGTIATIAPIAAGLSLQGAFGTAIGVATVVGGAMFGDNLSIISDTTIAAVTSQEADLKAKVKLNSKIALIASIITIIVLFFSSDSSIIIENKDYSLLKVSPYIFLIILAVLGVNVFIALVTSILFAFFIGLITGSYGILLLSRDITEGFASMQEIMILSLMVGGLSGLVGEDAKKDLASGLSEWISKHGSKRMAQLVIAKIVIIFDLLLANNTIAIIFSGEIARDIAKRYKIPRHYSAVWLDSFSCVFQGLIPYGAQILLASAIAGISPLSLLPYVYYCFALGIVCIAWILFAKLDNK
jgi:Na+/H+ antiporter NhaC